MQVPLTILAYRRVVPRPDPLFPEQIDARRFDEQLQALTRWFCVLPLSDAVRRLRERTLPARAACITFDNGYADNAAVALPILQRYAAPATFFVASGFLDGGCMWKDAVIDVVRNAPGDRLNLTASGFATYDLGCPVRRRAVIDMLVDSLSRLPHVDRLERIRTMARSFTPAMLTSDEVLALHRAGMEIGAQTVSHPVLTTISNADARAEIANGRARLQEIIQAPVRMFAYPSGKPGQDFEPRHVHMLRSQGFDAAVTSARGAARHDTDPMLLPRLAPPDRANGCFLLRVGGNLLMRPH
ncbi:polysaccharide deacetylase family protein [Massilia cavernae]|uniref:Polysaccharide deacetylase family protein n=1 Tax=Massilia cavernae TaxID=2320864 RepID=A0A418Y8A7_9BURK|nr:polysaccharide deacetylase family protein [Massilia cavernae]RJG27626.1 polysaccharide deacetylase family protein [Massilia cavernae]